MPIPWTGLIHQQRSESEVTGAGKVGRGPCRRCLAGGPGHGIDQLCAAEDVEADILRTGDRGRIHLHRYFLTGLYGWRGPGRILKVERIQREANHVTECEL